MRSMGVSRLGFRRDMHHPQAGFGHKFCSRKSRRTKRDRVMRNGADSRFSVYVKSKCLQQSRGYILVILVTAYPLLQFERTLIFFWCDIQSLDDLLKRT